MPRCRVGSQRERLQRAVPDLDAAEAIIDSWGGNNAVGGWAYGGKLWLTTRRLVFANHAFDAKLMGHLVWTCSLGDITEVSVAPRAFRPVTAWRRRLAVHQLGRTDFFIVNRVRTVASVIGDAVREHSLPQG